MSTKMTAWWGLCRREWLEHRAALAWTPLALGALLIVLTGLVALSNPERMAETAQMPDELSPAKLVGPQITNIIAGLLRPYTWLYFGVTTFLLLGTLFEERKDRTILFWKSMPTSGTQVVLSKLFVLVFVGALISLMLILVTQLYLVALAMANSSASWGISSSELWASAALGKSTLHWIAGYTTQLFWWLPIWGWLLLVSSIAPRLPILWALLVPLVAMVIESLAFDSSHFASGLVNHAKLSALPSALFGQGVLPPLTDNSKMPSLGTLWASSDMWLGVITGVLFIALAILFRQRTNEL